MPTQIKENMGCRNVTSLQLI
jgi:hypothetical protein